jgi:hypothetical protein
MSAIWPAEPTEWMDWCDAMRFRNPSFNGALSKKRERDAPLVTPDSCPPESALAGGGRMWPAAASAAAAAWPPCWACVVVRCVSTVPLGAAWVARYRCAEAAEPTQRKGTPLQTFCACTRPSNSESNASSDMMGGGGSCGKTADMGGSGTDACMGG